MTDPTPAATARELLLAQAFDEAKRGNAGVVWWQDIIRTPSWRALATAEAPGRVAALEAALRYALEHTDCHCASCDVDAPALLAAPAPSPARPLHGEDGTCTLHPTAPTPSEPVARCEGYDLVDRPDLAPNIVCTLPAGHVGYHKPAPAPTPSEPVARCGYPGCIRPAAEHRPCPAEIVGGRHFEQLACHPFTPGARDE